MNNGYDNQPLYTSASVQVATVGTSAAALPATGGGFVKLRARPGNAANITIGSSSSVTDGNGWTLEPGDELGPIVLENLNQLYAISGTAGQKLEILIQS